MQEKRLVQRALRIKMTSVNGGVVVNDGEHTGAFSGRVLRREDGDRIFEFLA
jgi:N-acyl-D-aspartate/D-glutamate deacylase